jgi:hypothetical protein
VHVVDVTIPAQLDPTVAGSPVTVLSRLMRYQATGAEGEVTALQSNTTVVRAWSAAPER